MPDKVFYPLNLKDGDILLVNAEYIDPQAFSGMKLPHLTMEVPVIGVSVPPGVIWEKAVTVFTLQQLKDVVQGMEDALAKKREAITSGN